MAHTQNQLTIEEALAMLAKSSLPTIVIEGADDMIVYRTFEDKLAHLDISVLPVGGRKKVLEIFKRRAELPPSLLLLFIVDKDIWITSGIPNEYIDDQIIFTHGYSIENDIYIDGDLERLLHGSECLMYQEELKIFIQWYALALSRHFCDDTRGISLHPEKVLCLSKKPGFLALEPEETYPTTSHDRISQNYQYILRGKSLLALLIKHTNQQNRKVRHSKNALLETVSIRPGALLNALYQKVEQYFSSKGNLPHHVETPPAS